MEYVLFYRENADELAKRNDPEQAGPYWAAWTAYIGAMNAAGIVKGGNGLQPPETATLVRVNGGGRHVQDGPFADSKEQLGGYMVIEVPDLDAALDWAAKAPSAAVAPVEVRPVLPPPPAGG